MRPLQTLGAALLCLWCAAHGTTAATYSWTIQFDAVRGGAGSAVSGTETSNFVEGTGPHLFHGPTHEAFTQGQVKGFGGSIGASGTANVSIGSYPVRIDSTVSQLGSVQICASFTMNICVAPSQPWVVTPNLEFNTTYTLSGTKSTAGGGASTAKLFLNGSFVDQTSSQVISLTNGDLDVNTAMDNPIGVVFGDISLMLWVETQAGCGQAPCTTTVSAMNTLEFSTTGPAFLGLPEGWTVFAPDFNIYDNQYIPVTSPIPLPGSLALALTGGAALAGLRLVRRS